MTGSSRNRVRPARTPARLVHARGPTQHGDLRRPKCSPVLLAQPKGPRGRGPFSNLHKGTQWRGGALDSSGTHSRYGCCDNLLEKAQPLPSKSPTTQPSTDYHVLKARVICWLDVAAEVFSSPLQFCLFPSSPAPSDGNMPSLGRSPHLSLLSHPLGPLGPGI